MHGSRHETRRYFEPPGLDPHNETMKQESLSASLENHEHEGHEKKHMKTPLLQYYEIL